MMMWPVIGYLYYTSIHRSDKLSAQTKSTKFRLLIYHVYPEESKHWLSSERKNITPQVVSG